MTAFCRYQLEVTFDGVRRLSVGELLRCARGALHITARAGFNMEELVATNGGVGLACVILFVMILLFLMQLLSLSLSPVQRAISHINHPRSYVGFTGSTGDAYANYHHPSPSTVTRNTRIVATHSPPYSYSMHKLHSWSFTSLSQSGSLQVIGSNENGQLGLGDLNYRFVFLFMTADSIDGMTG